MNRFEEDRNKKIYEITAVVKLLFVFFGAIAIFSHTIIEYKDLLEFGQTIFFAVFLFGLIYQLWMHPIRRTRVHNQIMIIDIIELWIHLFLIIIIILYTGGYESKYKILFLFTILTTSIQFGIKWGCITAGIASLSIGVIDLVSLPVNQPNPFFQSDLVLMGFFFLTSWLLGYYMHTENFYHNLLSNMAIMDELTGSYNHRQFHQSLKTQMERATATDESFSLLIADVDYFKYYNEIYGHQAGDKVLIQISRLIEENIGTKGTAFRYGGEEFAVIMPRADEQEALKVAENIRKAVQQHPFEGEKNQPTGKLTISIGVSTFPSQASNITEMITKADEALYRAKFMSKNKVEIYFSVLDELKEGLSDEHMDIISSIKTLISIINAKDRYTFGHTERVVQYSKMIGEAMELSETDMKTLQYGAYLHDIGKIEISKELLNKKEGLTDDEWDLLRQHPLIGAEIIRPVTSLENVLPLILHHHERIDGNGYPHSLKGNQIPLLVRILTVADSFDAMTTSRPYKNRKALSEAIQELKNCSGTQFDEEIVDRFVNVISEKSQFFDVLN